MNFIDKMVEQFIKVNRRMKRWQRVVSVLAAIVVFVTTYSLVLPAITLDKETASTQAGIEVAASENEAEGDGTVFEAEPEEEPAVEEPVAEEPAEEPAEGSAAEESAEAPAESQNTEEPAAAPEENAGDEAATTLTTDEAANYATTEEAIAAVTGQTTEEVKLITEDTQLTFDANDYTVYADFGESAKLPEGVQLQVKEITKESDPEAYEMYYEKALSEMQDKYDENTSLSFAKFYDIAFVYEGVEIEPSGNVNVRIEYKEAVEIEESTSVDTIHFDKKNDEKPEVINSDTEGTKKEVEAVEFKSDQFSVYGVIGSSLNTEFTIANPDGEDVTYLVTVTYGPEAKIPEGSTLRVTPFAEGSEEYDYARNAVLADKKEKGEFVDINSFGLAAVDISIIDPDGNEIEPAATVQVDIRIKELPGVEDLDEIKESLEVQHHVEAADGVVVEKVFDGSNEGSFKMATNEKVAAEGTAVDPNSVSDEDFRIVEEESADVDVSFNTEVFSTFTISWNNANGNGVTVHYVDESGNELSVANSVFPTTIGSNSASPAHLIYDIDGYEYDHTYRRYYNNNRWNEQNVVPELRRNNYGWRYSTNGDGWNNLSASNAQRKDEIYVVYKKKADVTQGGTPTLKPVKPEDYPEEPSILKESDPNGDGTADLSLSIIGHTKDREVEKLADVIVVFDVSGSMDYNLSGNTKRLAAAKTAVNNLVDNLAQKKNSDGNPLVRMALVPFSTSVGTITGLTDLTTSGTSTFKSTVNNLSVATGNNAGTNWDAALQAANEMAVDSGRATFVIFVTDGDPTFRNARTNTDDQTLNTSFWVGNQQRYDISEECYYSYHVYGGGNNDGRNNNYDAAVTQGQSIVGANKNLYTIGISNDVTKVSTFNSDAGGEGAYIAADAAALNQAFADIEAAIIAKLGISDIQMTDGITEMTQTVDKSGLTTTDGSFTYWKKDKGATSFEEWDPSSEGCAEAEYDEASGAVKWNMGTNFMPEDGATYKVTWKVWPSQEAYDILAKCRNNPSFYDTLTNAQKAQIIRTGEAPNYAYTLKTNEPNAGTVYKDATKSGSGITTEGDYKELKFNEVDPLGMASSQISIKKEWDNQLDGREVTGSYEFPVKADNSDFGTVTLSSTQNPAWQNSYFISTGLMTTNPYVVYEKGHDYTIEEPTDLSYNWDFKSDVYHPMVINNQVVNLVKVDTEAESDYTIDGKYYKALSGETVLTATNERRSNLNISKKVVDEDGNHIESDQAFTFTVTVDEGHDDDVWLSAYDTIKGETVMDSTIVTGTGVEYQESDGYFHAPSGTTLTLTLKDGWNYRFTNLSVGSTYTVEENSPVPGGFSFVSAEATATNDATAGTVTGQKTEGTIDKSNSVYTTAYTNEIQLTEADARKEWKNADGTTTAPTGASVEFTLYADNEATSYKVTLDGTADTEPTGAAPAGYESEGWTAKFVNLPKYKTQNGEAVEIVYTIAETTTYAGYKPSTTAPVASGRTITNTQEATTADAAKAWKNADGSTTAPEGASVVFTLYADGEVTDYTVTLDGTVDAAPTGTAGYESAAWKAEFVNLPKYQTGTTTEIEYTIAETTTYPGYTPSTTETVASGGTITNTQGSTDTFAVKAWKNADGSTIAPEGASVVFTLYADGDATAYTVTLDGTVDAEPTGTGGYESEAWKATFVKLPKYKKGTTTEIVYTIAETTTYPGYSASTTEPVGSGSTITNSQDSTSANATKKWVNADGTTEAPQGGQVTFTLYADGEATEYTVTLDGTADTAPTVTGGYESEAWKAEFVNLPKYKAGTTTEIVYTIAETGTYPGYSASTADPVASGGTITNTQEPTNADATKAWKNADGTTEAPEGATVEFTLYADGTATNYKVTLDGTADETVPTGTVGYESAAWKAQFVNLPKYKVEEGEAVEIEYTIGESKGYPGYTADPATPVAIGKTITNVQDDTEVFATKKWLNADGTDTAPEGATVTFTLFADGEVTNYTVELRGTAVEDVPTTTAGYESVAWTASFVHLPKFKADGTTEIVYTIAETTGYTGYKASTTGQVRSGESITNSQLSAEIKMLKIGDADTSTTLDGAQFELYSVWKGAGSAENVKARDYSGNEIGTITTADGGKATIGRLLPGTYYLVETKSPAGYKVLTDPVEINIQLVDEDPGYTVSYEQKDYSASSAAGRLSPDEDEAYLITVSNPSGDELPMTGGPGTLLYTLSGLMLILASAMMYGFRMRRGERRFK